MYAGRLWGYTAGELVVYRGEGELLEAVERMRARVSPLLVLLDGRGKGVSSEGLAEWLRRERDGGRQRVMFAVGPADGWSEAARGRADGLMSLGPMTLPHELARVVLLEQVYRAFTILAGHPYHTGH